MTEKQIQGSGTPTSLMIDLPSVEAMNSRIQTPANKSGSATGLVDQGDCSKKPYIEQIVQFATANEDRKVITAVSLGVLGILYFVFVICEGVYGFGGPDARHAFYVEGMDAPAATKKEAVSMAVDRNIEIRDGFPVDMAKVFRAWFLWGFWGSIVQILIILAFIPLFILVQRATLIKRFAFASIQLMACCSTTLWFFMGFFWRYSHGGRVVSGEKLERSAGLTDSEWQTQKEKAHLQEGYQFYAGSFMAVYLWIITVTFLLAATAVGVLAIKKWAE